MPVRRRAFASMRSERENPNDAVTAADAADILARAEARAYPLAIRLGLRSLSFVGPSFRSGGKGTDDVETLTGRSRAATEVPQRLEARGRRDQEAIHLP